MWLKELNLFSTVTQTLEPLFEYDSKNWTFVRYFRLKVKESNLLFFFNTTQRIEHLFFCMWLMFSYDLKNWFFIWLKEWYLTQRVEIYVFQNLIQRIGLFFVTRRLEFFFQKLWRKDFFLKNMTERIEPFLYDSKNWTFFFLICRKELSFFLLNFDSKNWAIFSQ